MNTETQKLLAQLLLQGKLPQDPQVPEWLSGGPYTMLDPIGSVGVDPDHNGQPRGAYQPSPDLSMYAAADMALGQAPRMTEGRPNLNDPAARRGVPPWQRKLHSLGYHIEDKQDAMGTAMSRAQRPGEGPSQRDTAMSNADAIMDYMREQSLILDRFRPELAQNPAGATYMPAPMAQPSYRPPVDGSVPPLDPDLMYDALRGTYDDASRFDDARAVQTADAGAFSPDRIAEEGPPPSAEQLVDMGRRVGIDPEALRGLDLNATEARSFGYLLRMMEAENTIREVSNSNTFLQRMLELLPGQDLETIFMDPDYRRYIVARENFNEAALRAATGATINQSEMPTQRRNYFPLPHDDDATRELMRRQREALLMSLTAASGPAAAIIPAYGQPVVPRQEVSDEEFLRSLGLE